MSISAFQRTLAAVFLIIFFPKLCTAQLNSENYILEKKDRILVLAPHPDDETIGAGGVIQRAVEMKLPVKVVYLTNGENNELAFLVYKKHPVLDAKGLMNMGELRRKEAIAAMQFLGLKEDQLTFLGYPDFGTQEMFVRFWGDNKPYKSLFTKQHAVPYKNAFSYQAPFKGESILRDLKKILLDFKPTKIFVTLPADTNRDHRAFYLYLQVALWDLQQKGFHTSVVPYVVHAIGWPVPRGYQPALPLTPPRALLSPELGWAKFFLHENEVQKKKDAIGFYKSQNAYNPKYLYSFARKNELFGQFKEIALDEIKGEIPWTDLELKQDVRSNVADAKKKARAIIRSVSYAIKGDHLYARLKINKWKSKLTGINLFLIGYSPETDFSRMPKYKINISFDKFINIYDQSHPTLIPNKIYKVSGDTILIGIPLEALKQPQYILTTVSTNILYIPLEATAWRTLVVPQAVCKEGQNNE